MRKPEVRFPTLVGLVIAGIGLWAGVVGIGNTTNLNSKAAPTIIVENFNVVNISDESFSVVWTTKEATSGYVIVKEDKLASFERLIADDRDQEKGELVNYFTHFVTVRNLKPATKYLIKVGNDKERGDWQQLITGPYIKNAPVADIAYGQVITSSQEPAEGALVIVRFPGSRDQATLVKPSGSWVVPLSVIRTIDLGNYIVYDKKNSNFDMVVLGGPLGSASVKVSTNEDTPVAITMLDMTKNIAPSALEFEVLTPTEGQSFTGDLIVSGNAPVGTYLTISLGEYVQKLQVDASQKFELPIKNLTQGEHNLSIVGIVDKKAILEFRKVFKTLDP